MTDDKPREFWVQKSTPDYVCDSQQELLECRTSDMMGVPFYRVIEHSAVVALEEKVKELEQLVTRYRLTSEVYLGERDQYKAEMNELYFIFDDQLKECQCDVDYCCPMHQLDKFKEGMK